MVITANKKDKNGGGNLYDVGCLYGRQKDFYQSANQAFERTGKGVLAHFVEKRY